MKLSLIRLGAPLSVLALASCASSDPAREDVAAQSAPLATLEQVTGFGPNPAGLNMYRYVPQGVPQNAPLVLVMHGCMQGAADIANAGWNQIADQAKFYVAYPEQTTNNNPMRCFNWAGVYGDPTNLHRGKGENESIKEMVDKMKADHSIDPKKVFVVGFSAGGAEVALMLATWPDVFAAGATFGGVAYDCAESVNGATNCMKPGKDQTPAQWGDLVRAAYPGYAGPWPRLSIWQGTADTIVDPMNTTQLMRQWTNVHGVAQTPASTDTIETYPHAVYKDGNGVAVVETYAITGKDHGIFVDPAKGCGTAQPYVLDAHVCSASYVADFFGITAGAAPGDGGASSGSSSSSGGTSSGGSTSGSSTSGGSSSGGSGGAPSDASANGATDDGGAFGSAGPQGCGLAGCSMAPRRTSLGAWSTGLFFAVAAWRRIARRKKGK